MIETSINDEVIEAPEELAEEPIAEVDTGAVSEPTEPDYEALIREDVETLKSLFPELSEMEELTELENPIRYAALRDLGLTPREAYLATTERTPKRDNRAHLTGLIKRQTTSSRGNMSSEEIRAAREIFDGMSDAEIQSLYRKVTFTN